MSQTINITASAAEYTWPATITEATGKDISGDVVRMSLALAPGGYTEPGTWVAPTVDTAQANHATRVVQLLVDSNTPVGTYYLWVRITDSPEVVPRRAHKVVVV